MRVMMSLMRLEASVKKLSVVWLAVCLSGCAVTHTHIGTGTSAESIENTEGGAKSSTTSSVTRWRLQIGSYVVFGELVPVKSKQQWRFVHPDTQLVVDKSGVVLLETLDGKTIDLGFARVATSQQASQQVLDNEAAELVKVTLGDTNYVVMQCDAWQQSWQTRTQRCDAIAKEPAHTSQVQLQTVKPSTDDTDNYPVYIEQWLPYLQMMIRLERI